MILHRGHLAAVTLAALFTCGAGRNAPHTEVTLAGGAGQYEFSRPTSGCATTQHVGNETIAHAAAQHTFAGHLVVDGGVTVAPTTVRSQQSNLPETQIAGSAAARVGGDWTAFGFLVGPQIYVHPQQSLLSSSLATQRYANPQQAFLAPSIDLRLGPDIAHAWGRTFPLSAPMMEGSFVQAGIGTRGGAGRAEIGLTGSAGVVGRGQIQISPAVALGADLAKNFDQGAFPGSDWRALGVFTYTVPPGP